MLYNWQEKWKLSIFHKDQSTNLLWISNITSRNHIIWTTKFLMCTNISTNLQSCCIWVVRHTQRLKFAYIITVMCLHSTIMWTFKQSCCILLQLNNPSQILIDCQFYTHIQTHMLLMKYSKGKLEIQINKSAIFDDLTYRELGESMILDSTI